jgi:predicted  nucleic acid-binding Zn-ribbon protein
VDLPGLDPQLHQEIPLKADPFVQLKLLDVQELDSRIDHLNHQLSSIPEAERLRELAGRRTAVSNAVRDLRIQVDDLTAEQKRADADVEQVKTRRARDQGMIDAGQVKDPKALERMLGELESLHRRITSLEDTELEVMERLEEAQSALEERSAELSEMEGQEAELRGAFEQKAGDLRTELEQARAERAIMVPGMPENLLALYEKLRAQKGGVGAAALRRRACEGCRLTLNASDLGIIAKKPTDEVVRCEECDRILVRTGESGLGSPV